MEGIRSFSYAENSKYSTTEEEGYDPWLHQWGDFLPKNLLWKGLEK